MDLNIQSVIENLAFQFYSIHMYISGTLQVTAIITLQAV